MGKQSTANAWLDAQKDKPSVNTDALVEGLSKHKLVYKVISDKEIILTDAVAAAYIELPIFRGERLIVDQHVQALYDEMARGAFNPLLVTLATAEFAGVTYKINGQHTCWAKYFAEGYEPRVREIKFKVNTAEDLRQLYASFDRNLARTDRHVTLIELANDPNLKDISATVIKFMSTAMKFWLFADSARRRCSPSDLAALIGSTHLDTFRSASMFYQKQALNQGCVFMRRGAVGAALLETFNKVPTKAPDFWQPVCDGIGLDSKTDPRWQLRAFLQEVKLRSSSTRGQRSVTEEDMYNHCIPCFNKWRKGEAVQRLVPTQMRVKAI